MALRTRYELIRQGLQDFVVPHLERICRDLADLRVEVRSLNEHFEMRTEIAAVRTEIGAVRTGIAYTNKRLDDVLAIRERLAALEGRLAHS